MMNLENLSLYVTISILAPLVGAFIILFLFFFEQKMEALKSESRLFALREELQRNKFESLSKKIQPHFFFNSLNSILSLARLDRKHELIHALESLSKFLKSKYHDERLFASIDEEIKYTNYYLEIQKVRFKNRLEVTKDIDPLVKNIVIPTYILQTLVENCFKHEFERYPGPALITIDIYIADKDVHMKIWNSKSPNQDRPSENAEVSGEEGMGLSNIKERLKILFPSSKPEVIFSTDSKGTTVHVKWPISYEGEYGNEHLIGR